MVSPEEIKTKAARKYKDFLRYEIGLLLGESEESFFPLAIRADTGNVNDDLLQRQKDLQSLIAKSKNKTGSGYTLELEMVQSRKNGEQTSISRIIFETKDDFLSFINEKSSYKRFLNALEQIKENKILSNDKLCEWSKSHLNDLLSEPENSHYWFDICLCAEWLNKNQDSKLYIREIPLPVHTKFIEQNSKLIQSLTEKSDSILSFEETFGLKTKPCSVRFRSLSERITLPFSMTNLSECQIPIKDFESLDKDFSNQIRNVFIVENEMVYLTFPKTLDSICVWGHGYTVNSLNNVEWFNSKKLYYFGDLDEHGFDIISSYRRFYPDIQSFCMDDKTWNKYQEYAVDGKKLDGNKIPENLTDAEKSVFCTLRNSKKDRIEQERISVEYIKEVVTHLDLL
jgi:hypothetical protein